jgi:VIT1/CCC1 family predicted Fe2+/Mn2+ transporter
MKSSSWQTGVGFGLTSGVITTVGLMVGLNAGTHSRIAVVGGILTVAIADALSDALGIHLAEESRTAAMTRDVWEATLSTFLAKLITAGTFAIPVLLFELRTSILVSIVWGLMVLTVLSTVLARQQGVAPWKAVGEHVIVAVSVVTISYYVGLWAKTLVE